MWQDDLIDDFIQSCGIFLDLRLLGLEDLDDSVGGLYHQRLR